MKYTISFLAIGLLLSACGGSRRSSTAAPSGSATYAHLIYKGKFSLLDDNTFRLDSITADPTYGYTVENPIMVGDAMNGGAKNQRRFLNALAGPQGEKITYHRVGSCCAFFTPNGFSGGGLLDKYEIKVEGMEETRTLYLNFYDKGVLKAPKGFTIRK